MATLISDLDHWDRVGGRVIQFYATDEEVDNVLKQHLPAKYEPYFLVGYDWTNQDGDSYVWKPFSYPVVDFLVLRRQGRWHLDIQSTVLTPDIRPFDENRIARKMSFNGLINIQHGSIRKGKWDDSSFTIVDKIINKITGESIEHEEYLAIYNSLKRGLKKILYYPTVRTDLLGQQYKQKNIMMSKAFAEKYLKGEINASAAPDLEV